MHCSEFAVGYNANYKCDICVERESSPPLCAGHREEVQPLHCDLQKYYEAVGPFLFTEFFFGCKDLSLPTDSCYKELDHLMMPKTLPSRAVSSSLHRML